MPQQQTYDNAYKQFFSHPEMVRDLLLGFFHEDWVRHLDYRTLERFNNTFTTENLREREGDVIWKVRFKGQWLYLYILIEAQSTVDNFMAVRLMTYVGLLYQDLIKQDAHIRNKKQLPPVLPIVLYNGYRVWKSPLNVHDLLDRNVPKYLKKYQPNLNYWLLDESRCTILNDIMRSNNVAAPLIAMEQSKSTIEMRKILEQLHKQLKHQKYDSLRRAYLVYLKRVFKYKGNIQQVDNITSLEEFSQMLEEDKGIWIKEWREKGLKLGREEGRKEGREEGREEGRKEALQLIAKNLLEQGMAPEQVAKITCLHLQDIHAVEE